MGSFTLPRIKEFMGFAGFMICRGILENLGWQINAIFAVSFGAAQLATNNCMGNCILLLNSALVGFNAGTGTRVSHHCVQDNKDGFKRVRRIAATVMFGWSLVVMIVFLVGQRQIGQFFSDNNQVQHLTAELCLLMGIMYFVMSLFFLCMAVLNNTGRPGVILVAFICGSYLVGLPCSYLFAFQVPSKAFAWWPSFQAPRTEGLGILGIWLGGTCGYATTTLVAGWKASQVLTQWPELVAQAKKTAEVNTNKATVSFVDHTLSMVDSMAPKDSSMMMSIRE
jgi:Na+-driven multidrug efflux pump